MVEHDLISLKSSNEYNAERVPIQIPGTSSHTYRFRLEPDISVHGSLAFRLVGNRTHGVFVCGIHEKSEQSKLLRNGDRILEISGIDVRKLTCDQIANILRLSMLHDGYAFLRVSRDKELQLLLRAHSNVADDPSSAESCALKRCYSSYCTEPPTHLRTSASDVTGFGDPHNENTKIRSCRTQDDFGDAEYVHLICFDELSEKVFTHCKRKRTYDVIVQPESEIQMSGMRWRCSVCFKLVRRKRWHMLKHEWASGAKKLLPRSASEFFDLEKHANVHYTLL